jgi:putative oxidoreductase
MAVTTLQPTKSSTGANARSAAAGWGIFFIRLTLGIIFFIHGSQKVLGWFGGHDLAVSATMMGKMGIIAPLAYLSILTEFVGGILLIIGALTRFVGVAFVINMAVAVILVHLKNGFFAEGPNGPGYEYNLALIAMSLALIFTGPGVLALGDWEPGLLSKR